jgi:hypothetical protein
LTRPPDGRVPPPDLHEPDLCRGEGLRCSLSKTKVFNPPTIDTQARFSGNSLKREPSVALCRLSWHGAKLLDDKRHENAPPPPVFLEANKKWKG